MDFLKELSVVEIDFALLALGNIISGVDDLVVDLYYWFTYIIRYLKDQQWRQRPLTDVNLGLIAQKRGAIFVAAWHEQDVIAEMLLYNKELIDYQNYDFFIACYPNDEPTQAKIEAAARQLPNVYKAVNPRPGPSNKADNLNAAFAELVRQEQRSGKRYDFIVMHDPEDIMHPLELQLYNYLLTLRQPDMIQTPVFPLEVPAWHFTAGTYIDEFAETHSKDIYVREWAGGFVPSAGVGTCISRNVFDQLAAEFGAKIFNTDSLTEDYDFGLRLKLTGHKAIFVRQKIWRTKDAWGRWLDKPYQEMIATRAHFPATLKTAVRQRTRWMLGIIFQNWKHFEWVGDWRTRWLLFHDRKGVWSNVIVMLNYFFVAGFTANFLLSTFVIPDTSPLLPDRFWINWLMTLCSIFMLNRIVQRVVATTRIYGAKQGLLALPRLFWSNLINISVTLRATRQFVVSELKGAKIAWDKTQHFLPNEGGASAAVPHYVAPGKQLVAAMPERAS